MLHIGDLVVSFILRWGQPSKAGWPKNGQSLTNMACQHSIGVQNGPKLSTERFLIMRDRFGPIWYAAIAHWKWPLSSPKGLRAESARAVTGRRCPYSGEGEDFLMGQLNFFTKTAVTPERKVKNRSQGGKLTVMPRAKNGSLTKIGVVWQKSDFWTKNRDFGPKKKAHFLGQTMFWPRQEKVVQRKKVPLPE